MQQKQSISVTAVVLWNDDGNVALVRKHNTGYFIFPGGKPEPGETGATTGVREVHEELGIVLQTDQLEYVGNYVTSAANEADTQLHSQVYRTRLPAGATVTAQAEIAELVWVKPQNIQLPTGTQLAPLSSMILEASPID